MKQTFLLISLRSWKGNLSVSHWAVTDQVHLLRAWYHSSSIVLNSRAHPRGILLGLPQGPALDPAEVYRIQDLLKHSFQQQKYLTRCSREWNSIYNHIKISILRSSWGKLLWFWAPASRLSMEWKLNVELLYLKQHTFPWCFVGYLRLCFWGFKLFLQCAAFSWLNE